MADSSEQTEVVGEDAVEEWAENGTLKYTDANGQKQLRRPSLSRMTDAVFFQDVGGRQDG